MITERQLQIMENGASPEVAKLCEEVRRYRDGIRATIREAHSDDARVILMKLFHLLPDGER